jgi:DNA-binding HxlR family transcriptional regulator
MRRSPTQPPRSGCPIGIALDLIGDAWTLLVVRDLMFKGANSFNDFLQAGEGIATNVLADRLSRLEAGGLVDKVRDPADARRFVYRLTGKGIDLAPVLVELVLWSARYEKTDAPPQVVRAMHTDREGFLARVRADWRASDPKRHSRAVDSL